MTAGFQASGAFTVLSVTGGDLLADAAGVVRPLQVRGGAAGSAGELIARESVGVAGPQLGFYKASTTTYGVVATLSELARIEFMAGTGAAMQIAANLLATVIEATPSATALASKFSFGTCLVGGVTVTATFSITAARTKVEIGILNIPTGTPASAAAAGVAGDHCWDADFIYVCTATNTWKRVAIATW